MQATLPTLPVESATDAVALQSDGGTVSVLVDLLLNDPLATLLLLVGALLVGVASAIFGWLSAGGALSWFFRLAG